MSHKITLFCCLLTVAWGYPQGPPTSSCGHMFPTDHGADAQTGAPYFMITLDKATYKTSGTIQVNISATAPNYFEGVFIQARSTNCSTDVPVGTFTLAGGESILTTMTCGGVTNGAVAHKKKEHVETKTFTWNVPSTLVGQVYFRGTFVRNEKTFWTNIFSPVLKADGDTEALQSKCPVKSINSGYRVVLSYTLMVFIFMIKTFLGL